MNKPHQGGVWAKVFLAAAVVSVLVPTLGPAPSSYAATPTFCLVCGEQGGADVIANTVLFVPLGITLALQGWRVTTQLLVAAALTFFIESAQTTLIPGRDASVGDLVFNTLGAAVGIGLATSFRLWLTPTPAQRRLLLVMSGLLAGLTIITTGELTQPDLDAAQYRSQWTQRVSGIRYGGAIDSVTLGTLPLSHGYVDVPNLLSDSIEAGVVMRIRGRAGPPPVDFAPIYTIRAQRNLEVWVAGQVENDLAFQYRPVAARARLRRPGHRLNDVMDGYAKGDAFSLEIQRARPGFDIRLGDDVHHMTFRARDGWRLFLPTFDRSWLRSMFNYVWIAGLFFPFGLWMTRSWASVVSAGSIGSAFVTVWLSKTLGVPGMIELVGGSIGLLAGFAVQRIAGQYRTHPSEQQHPKNVQKTT